MRSQERELARAARHALVGATGTALAHEISQPLASTTNYLHAARRILLESKGGRHADAADTLAKAEAEARRVRETLERVRDYISSGRVELSEVDIEAVAGKIASVLGREDGRGVRIEVSCAPDLPRVRGDAIQLEQLLLNLMSNAVEAARSDTPEHGLVRVRVQQRGDRVLVEVDDSGAGVAPDVADRLFEPFETSKPNGMGLGLTLARQIVEAHAGQLHWQNLPGGGARFAVALRINGPRGHGR
jgi:two-component system sensor kinase FixL